MGKSYHQLGVKFLEIEDFEKAKICFEHALEIKMKYYKDPCHPSITESLDNLKKLEKRGDPHPLNHNVEQLVRHKNHLGYFLSF